MQKLLLPGLLAGTLALGGCAAYGNPLGGVFGNNDDYGYGYNDNIDRAAAEACGREASRYGRVSIQRVDRFSSDVFRVEGRIDSRDSRRDEFRCDYRTDGRILDFRLR